MDLVLPPLDPDETDFKFPGYIEKALVAIAEEDARLDARGKVEPETASDYEGAGYDDDGHSGDVAEGAKRETAEATQERGGSVADNAAATTGDAPTETVSQPQLDDQS